MDTETNTEGPSEGTTDTFDLGEKLTARLNECTAERDRTQRHIDIATNKLQNLFKVTPKRPRDSKVVLRERVKKLERDRTSRSLPLSQEKILIRQIDSAKKAIRQHDDCEGHQELIRRKKAEIESARESLRSTNASISEIEAVLSKVELAKRLGCSTSDLITRVVDCPVEKLGRVIGKNGATLKAIEESARVHIDVDKIRGKIHVQGNASAAEEAVAQLENLTLAVDEEIEVSADSIAYLLTQNSAVLNKIKENNPDVYIDVLAKIKRIYMRGHPEKVQRAKYELSIIRVVSKTRLLVGKEVAVVVGKAGSTISSLSDKYSVVLEVSKDASGSESSTLRVVGPSSDVNAAMAEVDRLLFQNEDIEESIPVNPLLKNQFLTNSGAAIKEFQTEVNNILAAEHQESSLSEQPNIRGVISSGVLLVFDRSSSKDSPPALSIKCIRRNMERAKELVRNKIDEFDSNLITIHVPPEIIPAVIGKGGAKINSLRKEGVGAEIEADSRTATVKVHSSDPDTREAIRSAIQKIVAENQVGYVSIEQATIGLVLGEPGKEVREKVSEIGCNFGVDDDSTRLAIRGTEEQIAEASEILKEFIAKNYVGDLEIDPDDEPLLFVGGSNSILSQVDNKYNVKANYRKLKNVVSVRGEMAKVNASLEDIKRFLNGGDGFAVCKFKVPEAAIGNVIGKGGGNISKLETDFDGVRIYVPRESNTISIRGPEELVRQCRVRLITTVATSKVTDTIALSPPQNDDILKSDLIKKVSGITNAQISLQDSVIRIRGVSNDVRDAKSLLNEHLTGVYVGYIDLEGTQCTRLKNTVTKDPSHFERIQLSTGASIVLDSSECIVQVSGKRASVKKAKLALMGFLDFMFPQQFQTLKVHKTLFKSMGDPGSLADIAAVTGASLSLDRDMNCILVRSESADDSTNAVHLVSTRLAECEKLNAVYRYDTSESWLLPVVIGKGGATIQRLTSETGCSIAVFKDEVTVVVSAEDEETVLVGKKAFEAVVEQARKECIFINIPESAMASFIGKGGAHIKQMAEQNNVDIERMKKQASTLKITGKEDSVAGAKESILLWLKDWEASHVGLTIEVEEQMIPSVLGKGGETIRSIQKDTGCKVDINRQHLTLTVRDGNDSDRQEAIKRVKTIIEEEKAKIAERAAAKEKLKQEQAALAEQKAKNTKEITSSSVTAERRPKDVMKTDSGFKDRSNEFAARPVGLSLNKNKGKNNTNSIIENGTKEGRELFLMLISGNNVSSNQDENLSSSAENSDGAIISVVDSNNGESTLRYRSVSGFTVRI